MNTQPTPETDREDIIITKGKPTHWVSQEFARRLKRERDEARETLAATLRAWQTAQEKIIAVTTQRDEAREELTDMIEQRNYFLIRLEKAQEQMIDAEKQRDRLAEVMAQILNTTMNHTRRELLLEQALQSLTPKSQ